MSSLQNIINAENVVSSHLYPHTSCNQRDLGQVLHPVWRMWRPVAALRLNSTPVIACYHPFILYLKTFCGVSDCILNENIIINQPQNIIDSSVCRKIGCSEKLSLQFHSIALRNFCFNIHLWKFLLHQITEYLVLNTRWFWATNPGASTMAWMLLPLQGPGSISLEPRLDRTAWTN